MEAIAAASSISALVGIAGESLKLIFRLSNLWRSLVHASAEIDELIQGLKLLEEVLQHTETIAVKYRALSSSPSTTVVSLHRAVKLCHDQLAEWLEEANNLKPSESQRSRSWMKKLKIVSHQAHIQLIGEKVRSHLGKITLLVNILNGYVNFHLVRSNVIFSSTKFPTLCR